MNLEEAVQAPRLHLEREHMNAELGFSPGSMKLLDAQWPGMETWREPNLFFGGVHAVARMPNGEFDAAGDPRRGGAVAFAES